MCAADAALGGGLAHPRPSSRQLPAFPGWVGVALGREGGSLRALWTLSPSPIFTPAGNRSSGIREKEVRTCRRCREAGGGRFGGPRGGLAADARVRSGPGAALSPRATLSHERLALPVSKRRDCVPRTCPAGVRSYSLSAGVGPWLSPVNAPLWRRWRQDQNKTTEKTLRTAGGAAAVNRGLDSLESAPFSRVLGWHLRLAHPQGRSES